MEFEVNELISGGIMTNYDCTVRCAHCRHNASPEREKGFISEQMVNTIIQKLEAMRCTSVHIEGGEPFLYPKELARTVKQIQQSNIFLEHIVTNCSWYKNQKEATLLLKELKSNGLTRLLVKVGPFQNESIPLRKVTKVAEIADKLGINVMIWDNELYPEVASFDQTKTHSLNQYIKKYGPDYMNKVAGCFNVSFAGRTFKAYEKYLIKTPLNDILLQNKGCVQSFPTQHHFHIDRFGNFVFSHTNGVTMQLNDVGEKIDPKRYPFLTILLHGGVNSLYRLATSKYNYLPKKEYLSKCHLCYDLRRFLVAERNVDSPDLQPREFYLEK